MPPLATGKRRKYRKNRRRPPCAGRHRSDRVHTPRHLSSHSLSFSFLPFFHPHSQLQSQRQYKRLLPNANPRHKQTPCSAIPTSDLDRELTTSIFLSTSPIMSAPTENVSTNGVAPETQQSAADSQTPSAPAEPNVKVRYLLEAEEVTGKGRCSCAEGCRTNS